MHELLSIVSRSAADIGFAQNMAERDVLVTARRRWPAVRFHSHTFLSIVVLTENVDWTLQTADVVPYLECSCRDPVVYSSQCLGCALGLIYTTAWGDSVGKQRPSSSTQRYLGLLEDARHARVALGAWNRSKRPVSPW